MNLLEKSLRFTRAREAQAAGYYPFFIPIESSSGSEVMINGEPKIMMGSNNYLGLTHHPKILAAAEAALKRYGSGCTGSRFLNGTLDLHEELEDRLARFLGKEAALVFSTGYQANLGAVSTLIGREDYIFMDKLNHASLVDSTRLTFGAVCRYAHNDMKALKRQLEQAPRAAGKLIVTDGVFSMEGDIVNLPEVVTLAEAYDADILVDDAHALGVLGARGGGTAQHFDLVDKTSLIVATFSKSLASIGGVVVGAEPVIHYLKHHARSLIFSASMPPASVATVLTALDVIEEEPELREKLWRNTQRMQDGLKSLGYDIGDSETPVIPVLIGDLGIMLMQWRMLFDAGVFTNPVIPPAVPHDSCCLRISMMATHTDEQI
ncbi:MAG: aminotransferase class I/II-fold pyridoxal phosphate-dependent enzyme, partial [Candidatus Binatia bacterium]